MSKSEAIVNIVNVVVSVTLKHKLDLSAIVKAFPNVEYNPEQFPGAVFRLKRPKSVILIFGTGKMVCVGAKSEKQARSAVRAVINSLKKAGILMAGKPKVTIQNIVAQANLSGTIDLVELCELERRSGGRIIYEPEQFPAIIYRMNEPRAVILIFASGKLVCTGIKREKDVRIAVDKLLCKLEDHNIISIK
jgi:transcription initiation factor TFIID TATA-box-binding protein